MSTGKIADHPSSNLNTNGIRVVAIGIIKDQHGLTIFSMAGLALAAA